MLIITKQASKQSEKLEELLRTLGRAPRMLLTDLDTDLEKGTDSLLSPFIYHSEEDYQGEPLFFNDLSVPPLWELWTTGLTTQIFDGRDSRANLVFRKDYLSRTVDRVEWFGQGETIAMIDYYNRYGWRHKQRQMDATGQPLIDTYFNRHQEEVILHYLKSDYFLYQKKVGRDQFFLNQLELLQSALEELLHSSELVVCMDRELLGQLEFIQPKQVVLCSENHDDIEGVQDKVAGMIITDFYPIEQRKPGLLYVAGTLLDTVASFSPKAMVMTNSENVEGLDQLVEKFPEVDFYVAALTNMGAKLTYLERKPNVHLYPGVTSEAFQQLLEDCSIYLDLNHGIEMCSSSFEAIENSQLIFGLETTVHHDSYKNLSTVYSSLEDLEDGLSQLLKAPQDFSSAIAHQKECLHLGTREKLEHYFQELVEK